MKAHILQTSSFRWTFSTERAFSGVSFLCTKHFYV